MVSLLIGIALATGASTLYSVGIAVQALDARDVSQQHALRISLLAQLMTRMRWLFGTGMTVLGWPLQIVALAYAPLVVVQPALASGLLVLLLAGERILGESPGRREMLSVAAIVAGVAGIAALAPGHNTHHVHGVAIYVVLSAARRRRVRAVRAPVRRPRDGQRDDDRRRPRLRLERSRQPVRRRRRSERPLGHRDQLGRRRRRARRSSA